MGGCADSFIITLYTQVETCPFCKICRLFRSQVTGAGNIKQGWLPHAQLGFALVTGVEEGWRNRTGNGIVHIIILNSAAEFTLLLQKFSTCQIIIRNHSGLVSNAYSTIEQNLNLLGWSLEILLSLGSLKIEFAAEKWSIGQIHESIVSFLILTLYKINLRFLMAVNRLSLDFVCLLSLSYGLIKRPVLINRIALVNNLLINQVGIVGMSLILGSRFLNAFFHQFGSCIIFCLIRQISGFLLVTEGWSREFADKLIAIFRILISCSLAFLQSHHRHRVVLCIRKSCIFYFISNNIFSCILNTTIQICISNSTHCPFIYFILTIIFIRCCMIIRIFNSNIISWYCSFFRA